MTIHGSLAYAHYCCDSGKGQTVGEPQFHHPSCLRRDFRLDQTVNPGNCFIIRSILGVIFIIVKEITVSYALMNLTVPDMVNTAVADCPQKIGTR